MCSKAIPASYCISQDTSQRFQQISRRNLSLDWSFNKLIIFVYLSWLERVLALVIALESTWKMHQYNVYVPLYIGCYYNSIYYRLCFEIDIKMKKKNSIPNSDHKWSIISFHNKRNSCVVVVYRSITVGSPAKNGVIRCL